MMATREKILRRLYDYLQPMAPQGVEVAEDTDLVATMGLDSNKVLDLLLDLEDDFDVLVPMEALVDVQTVGDLADVILSKLEED
jgi:acyl carrier protein